MVIFRKESKKKNANRSAPCILVQNLGVAWKRTHSSSFFLSLSPDAGERWLGCGGFRLLPSPHSRQGRRGAAVEREKPAKTLSHKGCQRKRHFCFAGLQGPTLWGWRKPMQVLELRSVRAQWQGWDWWVGRVCLRGTVQREERGGGRAGAAECLCVQRVSCRD